MKSFPMRFVAGVLVVFAALVSADGKQKAKVVTPPPFRCFTTEWSGGFVVGKPAYDAAKAEITWELEAKQATALGKYEAFMANGDGVEVGTVEVKFTPAQSPLKAGAKVKATVQLKELETDSDTRLTIRTPQ